MQSKKFPFEIKTGTIKEAVTISRQLPEFADPHGPDEYEKRLSSVPHLILVAWHERTPVGFKVGYERKEPLLQASPYFYSWMGGVLPDYRRKGIAKALADTQEEWARQHNYPHVTFKTRNRHRGMLLFGISNGFQIIRVEAREDIGENRILLRKFF